MSVFSKAKKYRKPSHSIDEKVKLLNQDLEKTGVVVESAPANSSTGVYSHTTFENDGDNVPKVIEDVPDPTGFRDTPTGGSADNASDIDPSDSSTWATGGQGMDDLINPNTLPVENGPDLTDQPTVETPDLTGFKPLRSDPDNPDSGMNKYSGIARTSLLGVWGTSTGIIGEGNKFHMVLAAFGWPTGPSGSSETLGDDYPSDRSFGGFYRGDDDATYSARLNMKATVNNIPEGGKWVPYKCWILFNSYGFGETWAQYKSNPSNIWREDGYAYVQVSVYAGPGKYNSQEPGKPQTTVVFQGGLGDPNYYPGNSGQGNYGLDNFGPLSDWIRDILDIGQNAFDWLWDQVNEVTEAESDFLGHLGHLGGEALDAFNDLVDDFKDFAGQIPPPAYETSFNIANSILQNKPIEQDITDVPHNDVVNLLNNLDPTSVSTSNQQVNYSDDNFYVDDSGQVHAHTPETFAEYGDQTGSVSTNAPTNWVDAVSAGVGYENPIASWGNAQTQFVIPDDGSEPYFLYTDHAYHNTQSTSSTEISNPITDFLSGVVHAAADLFYGTTSDSPNTGEMSGYPPNIAGDVVTNIKIPYSQLPPNYQAQIQSQGYNPGTKTESYNNEQLDEPQGNLLSEGDPALGWASPKHTDVDKDEKKRWFKQKDIQPEYPKKKPPKMVHDRHPDLLKGPKKDASKSNDLINVSDVDLLRNYNVRHDQIKKCRSIIKRLNSYITRNVGILIHLRERYPKDDPRLAQLNYKLDMQNAASDEYMSKHFPENEKLFNRVVKATQRSITLTDPKTYKDKKGKMTSYKKLLRVDYVLNEYDPKDSELKIKKIKSDKKSIGRFFRKPKKKTKDDILKDKMAVLDKEMKKTMPDW